MSSAATRALPLPRRISCGRFPIGANQIGGANFDYSQRRCRSDGSFFSFFLLYFSRISFHLSTSLAHNCIRTFLAQSIISNYISVRFTQVSVALPRVRDSQPHLVFLVVLSWSEWRRLMDNWVGCAELKPLNDRLFYRLSATIQWLRKTSYSRVRLIAI